MKQLTFEELVDEGVGKLPEWANDQDRAERADYTARLQAALARADVTGLVLFRNEDMWSSALGRARVYIMGPACTYKTPADLPERLNGASAERAECIGYHLKE